MGGRHEQFLTRGQGNFGLEHGLLSNPLANLQISPFLCFQEVCSHQLRMVLNPLRTVARAPSHWTGWQNTHVSVCLCVHMWLHVQVWKHMCTSFYEPGGWHSQEGVVRKSWAQTRSIDQKNSSDRSWLSGHQKKCKRMAGHFPTVTSP